MNRRAFFGLAVAIVAVALMVTWNATGATQDDPPPPDVPDPTSELLPPAVSEDEWTEYVNEAAEKAQEEISTEPILLTGPEAAGIAVDFGWGEVQLPDDVYIVLLESSPICKEDPHGTCSIAGDIYLLNRTGSTHLPDRHGEIAVAEQRAWYFPGLHPDLRPEVFDAYLDFRHEAGIEELEDIGYQAPPNTEEPK